MRMVGAHDDDNPQIHVSIGKRVLVLNHRYEALSILNDIFIGVFFTIGSILFFFSALETWAITMFLLGSIEFLLRPVIRLARRFHTQGHDEDPDDDSYDY